MILSEASLADLNTRMEKKAKMEHFRPNIVVTGCGAFEEVSGAAVGLLLPSRGSSRQRLQDRVSLIGLRLHLWAPAHENSNNVVVHQCEEEHTFLYFFCATPFSVQALVRLLTLCPGVISSRVRLTQVNMTNKGHMQGKHPLH